MPQFPRQSAGATYQNSMNMLQTTLGLADGNISGIWRALTNLQGNEAQVQNYAAVRACGAGRIEANGE